MTERWAWEHEWLKRLGKRETKRRLDKIWDIVHDPGIPNDDQRGLLWQSLVEHYRIESDYRTTKEVKQEFVYYLAKIQRELKIAAVVVGIFFAALASLQYIGIAKIDLTRTENMTREAAQHVLTQVTQVVNNTATTMATHLTVLTTQGLTIAAIAGFFPGLALGLKIG